MSSVKRRYVSVDGRRVLYRRAGAGPPLVMLHGSPGSSEMLHEEIAAAARNFTVFAPDTPGFGGSDPLRGDTLTVYDLAAATAAAMAALGLPACPVYGTHTGALIAAELGARHPERVSGLVMEGLPLFTDEEIATLFQGYFEKLVPDPLGGHLTATWIRFRDQHTWFPWTSRDITRLNPVDRPTPEEIEHWVTMFYRSCATYMPAYRAACFHGQRGLDAVAALDRPAVFLASAEDMLYPHLDRLPPLKPGQRILRLEYDPPAKFATIVNELCSLPSASGLSDIPEIAPAGSDPALQYIDTRDGQLLIRCYGNPANEAVILLHDGPGSGLRHVTVARRLAAERYVVVPDLPGCGESDNPARPVLEAAADAVSDIADALGLTAFVAAGIGCGATVAARLTDPRLNRIIVEDPPSRDPAVAAKIAPDLPLTPEGSHWLKAWLMVRDSQIYAPWFDGRVAAQRRDQGNFDAAWLHAQTVEIVRARRSYFRLPREAWLADTAAALAAAHVPVREGPISQLLEIRQ